MGDWLTRIPVAIADGEKKLEGYEVMVVPPHTGGNDTRLTVGITAGEVALAKVLFKAHHEAVYKILRVGWDEHEKFEGSCTDCAPLRTFTEKIESLQVVDSSYG